MTRSTKRIVGRSKCTCGLRRSIHQQQQLVVTRRNGSRADFNLLSRAAQFFHLGLRVPGLSSPSGACWRCVMSILQKTTCTSPSSHPIETKVDKFTFQYLSSLSSSPSNRWRRGRSTLPSPGPLGEQETHTAVLKPRPSPARPSPPDQRGDGVPRPKLDPLLQIHGLSSPSP